MNPLRFKTVAVGLLLLTGCRQKPELGPPELQPGQSECAQCRMIISEERYAAGLAIPQSDGVEKLAFDDIGCLLEHLRQNRPAEGYVAYVRDHQSGRWLNAASAVFVSSQTLQTPMASNLAAVDSPQSAQRLLQQHPGRTLRFQQLLDPEFAAERPQP